MMEVCPTEERINLLVTLDQRYLRPLSVMLRSYSRVHTGVITDLYIAHSSLEEADFSFLEQEIDDPGIHIHGIRITEHYFCETPVLERLPEESFYRLLAFTYLPESVEKCLYLDPDILVCRSLLPLYSVDMGEAYIAAAGHLHGLLDRMNRARLGIHQETYINSGVMLMNIRKIRERFTLKSVLDSLEQNVQRLIMGDQDLVNILLGERVMILDACVYNLDERTYAYHNRTRGFTLDDVREQTAIIHYNGKYKPWLEGYRGVLNCFYPAVEKKGAAPTGVLKGQIRSFCRITKPTRQQRIVLVGMVICAFLCMLSYLFFGKELLNIVSDPATFREWLDTLGPFDELVFILIRAMQTVVKFIPAEPLEIASGYAWGAFYGMVYCVIGNLLGTLAILALTKKFGKTIIDWFFPTQNSGALSLLKNSDNLYALLFFLYLIPGSPKDGFTYFAGLLSIRAVPFLIITGIARIPSVLSSTVCGATLAQQHYGVSALILVATLVLALFGGLVYRRLIKSKAGTPNQQTVKLQ